jgi:hypothetical protein
VLTCAYCGQQNPEGSRLVPNAPREHFGVLTASAVMAETKGDLEQGLALLGAGRSLLGHSGMGEMELRAAREIFSTLHAGPPLEETEDLLVQAIAQTS